MRKKPPKSDDGTALMATPQEKAAALKKAKAEFVEVCGRACTLRDVCVTY